jgi:acyl-CoA thioesterase I
MRRLWRRRGTSNIEQGTSRDEGEEADRAGRPCEYTKLKRADMMTFIWFCAAGKSFGLGRLLLLLTVFLSVAARRVWQRLLVYAATLVAAAMMIMAATPLAMWFLIVWALLALVWLGCLVSRRDMARLLWLPVAAAVLMGWTVAAGVMERPFQRRPTLPQRQLGTLYVVGDSVSGGIGRADEQTWPLLLGRQHGVSVVNLARSGATVATALKQVEQIDAADSLVLVEIGGNDFFGPTPYAEFRRDLGQLLVRAGGNGRVVVMMEVPLLPWQLEYGRIQRQLAREHDVVLIPKRYFVKVLSAPGASVDLAHLSPEGHQLMAGEVWAIVGKSLRANGQQRGVQDR